jgi:NADH dehydrogenase
MILVTGGTGTLGRELVQRLVDAGERVRVLTRDRARASALPAGVDVVLGDLRDDASILEAIRGCETVISAAHGFVGPDAPSPEAIDRDGNRRLVRAAVDAEVGHFVLVSVAGAAADHAMSLARAKFAAERELRASGLRFTIVRATPFMETWRMILGGMLDAKGHALVFGPGTNPVNFVSVRDVAALVVLAVRGEASNEAYEIGGPENLGLATVAERVIQARGKAAPIKHIPLVVLRMMSVLARPFSPAFARQAQAAVLMNTTDMTVDPAARARLPALPVTRFADVLAG